ncbi:Ecotin [Pseudomonas fluorescens]|uniref:serine protease inhibitor ecotin n=1 Tax=Pseudomonas fluorescens TaxID=294 RepID=UPI00125A82DC|nr:serine protease inhibitor ecotin [Pseudomonas fluorescens]CAG8863536.1 Ecotin [Pseudomonas fluorescens]VVP84390.1 Ecotin [Pseudomonas fluorescens]
MRISILYPAALALSLSVAQSALASDLTPFPEAEEGFTRHVVRLPQQAEESLYQVELYAGKTLEVDCNHHRYGGKLESITLEGWGYTYLKIAKLQGPVSTYRGCAHMPGMESRFIHATPYMTRYNSKLPLVVYAAKDVEIRYRIWSTSETLQAADRQ